MNSPTATLLREAADRLGRTNRRSTWRGISCDICNALLLPIDTDTQKSSHTPDCLITRLRVEAEKMEKGG